MCSNSQFVFHTSYTLLYHIFFIQNSVPPKILLEKFTTRELFEIITEKRSAEIFSNICPLFNRENRTGRRSSKDCRNFDATGCQSFFENSLTGMTRAWRGAVPGSIISVCYFWHKFHYSFFLLKSFLNWEACYEIDAFVNIAMPGRSWRRDMVGELRAPDGSLGCDNVIRCQRKRFKEVCNN